MTTLVTNARATSAAPPSAFFDRRAGTATWPGWTADVEWARLEGSFAVGTTGVVKPRKGPKTKFVIEQLDPDRAYVDVLRLPGARLASGHLVTTHPGGGCSIDVTISMSGALAWLWTLLIAKGSVEPTQSDLDRLVAVVETGG
jgi:hypothetical protein